MKGLWELGVCHAFNGPTLTGWRCLGTRDVDLVGSREIFTLHLVMGAKRTGKTVVGGRQSAKMHLADYGSEI